MDDAKQKLSAAAQSVSTAVMILRMEMPVMEAFIREARNMDSFGHIVDPTLYRSSERRASEAVVLPLFQSAVALVKQYDAHVTKAREALEAVSSN